MLRNGNPLSKILVNQHRIEKAKNNLLTTLESDNEAITSSRRGGYKSKRKIHSRKLRFSKSRKAKRSRAKRTKGKK